MMSDGVRLFLDRIGVGQHFDMFLAKGFDTEDDIAHLTGEDLSDMYITDLETRKLILESAESFTPSDEHRLQSWLRGQGLEHYFISFIQSELASLEKVALLQLPDVDVYDELEITLPGHQRRLERAVKQLAEKMIEPVTLPDVDVIDDCPLYPQNNSSISTSGIPTTCAPVSGIPTSSTQTSKISTSGIPTQNVPTSGITNQKVPTSGVPTSSIPTSEISASDCVSRKERPVAIGRWGKPRCLRDAKYDFLLLDAAVVSTIDVHDRVTLEFMVDSGSDVVTIRQEVLDTLDLELIGPINSKGVHASRVKNLYKANLQVGNELVEIEVMGESYDSIGSRVIRHFRHYVTGTSHFWLKGNYVDPTMLPSAGHSIPENTSILPLSHDITVASDSSNELVSKVDVKDKEIETLKEHGSGNEEKISVQSSQSVEKAELDSSMVQSDSALIRTDLKNISGNEPSINIDSAHKIDFKFVSNSAEKEKNGSFQQQNGDSSRNDETDKLLHSNGEIVDVRPIIAANRKRHASSQRGFDPGTISPDRENGKIVKKNKSSKNHSQYSNGRNTVCTTIPWGKLNGKIMDKVSDEDENGIEVLRTVLNQRSVYYRSLAKELPREEESSPRSEERMTSGLY